MYHSAVSLHHQQGQSSFESFAYYSIVIDSLSSYCRKRFRFQKIDGETYNTCIPWANNPNQNVRVIFAFPLRFHVQEVSDEGGIFFIFSLHLPTPDH